MGRVTTTGDSDELVPGVPDQAWRQVAVTARECLGVSRCPFGVQCFSERARRMAAESDVVVTNHALLAIDTLGEGGILPEHRVVIVDEAHELVDRVTSVATGELSAVAVDFAVAADRAKLADDGADRAAVRGGQRARPAARHHARAAGWTSSTRASARRSRRCATRRTACAGQVRKIAAAKGDDADPAEVTAAQTALVASRR